jgi:hypothetical protein
VPNQLSSCPVYSAPHSAVTISLSRRPILTDAIPVIHHNLHSKPIQESICKRERWSSTNFHSVDWEAHESFRLAHSCQRITYTKIAHNLLNTNRQNSLFYGGSSLFPGCLSTEETFGHVLQCPATSIAIFRQDCETVLWKYLSKIQTPPIILAAIRYGLDTWSHSTATKATSLPDDVTAAIASQSTLGWDSFLRGRISLSWRTIYTYYSPSGNFPALSWAGHLVRLLLDHSATLWNYRNGIIHGHNLAQSRAIQITELSQQIQVAYDASAVDPHHIPSNWRHLFRSPLEQLLCAGRDTMQCWLHSYNEAVQVQLLRSKSDQMAACQFFSSTFTRPSVKLEISHNSSTPPPAEILLSSSCYLAVETNSYYDTSDSSMCDDNSDGTCPLTARDGNSAYVIGTFPSRFLST